MQRYISIALVVLTALVAEAGQVTVTSVMAVQRPDEPIVDISYDLLNPSGGVYTVLLYASTNSGATYSLNCTHFSGDVGAGVTTGTLKQVVWSAAGDFPFTITSQAHVRVTATETIVATNDMALIPAGAFVMGNCMDAFEGYSIELPVHTVMVSAFYMNRYLVTSQQWFEVRNWAIANGYTFDHAGSGKAADHPAQTINWYDCVKWCNARSEKEGLTPCYYTNAAQTLVYRGGSENLSNEWVKWTANGYRLPTEAEWEKAARGGLNGRRFSWNDLNITHTNANYISNAIYSYDTSATRGFHPTFVAGDMPYTSPVGYFAPNGYGLYDMTGNVYEWCWDRYSGLYYSISPANDPCGPASGASRVLRGGYWYDGASVCRVASRHYDARSYSSYYYGFRCVRGQ